MRRLFLVLLCFAVLLAGCASGASSPTSGAGTPTSPGSPVFTPSTAPNVPAVSAQPATPPPGTIAVGAVGWTLSARGTDPEEGNYQVAAVLQHVDPVSAASVAPPAGQTWVLVTLTLRNEGSHAYTPDPSIAFQLLSQAGEALSGPVPQPAIVPPAQALPETAISPGGSASGELLFAAPADASTPLGISRGLWLGWRPVPSMRAGQFAWSVS